MNASPVEIEKYALHPLPHAQSRFELPPEYFDARSEFEKAEKAYDAGQFEKAAQAFIECASLLHVEKPTTYSGQFAEMRKAAYRNAVSSWKLAKKKDAGRSALEKARASDAENRALLDELIAQLK